VPFQTLAKGPELWGRIKEPKLVTIPKGKKLETGKTL